MKKGKIICLTFLLIFIFSPLSVQAHPGRTDASGGHYNRSTGEYHYHHGYSAHQHPNGICPYDFDDATDRSSNSTNATGVQHENMASVQDGSKNTLSGYNQVLPNNQKKEPSSTPKKTESDSKKKTPSTKDSPNNAMEIPSNLLGFLVIGVPCLYVVYQFRKKRRLRVKEEQEAERLEKERLEKERMEKARLVKAEQERLGKAIWLSQYGGKLIEDIIEKPDDSYINEEELPCSNKGIPPYGKYNVFLTKNGTCYHQKKGCCNAKLVSNYYLEYTHLRPCSKCHIQDLDVEWIKKYKGIMREKRRMKITDEDIKEYLSKRQE